MLRLIYMELVGTLNGNDYPSKPTHSWNSKTQMTADRPQPEDIN